MHESCEHFERALKLSQMYPNSWFTFGCTCMYTKQWNKGLAAFKRQVQLVPEDKCALTFNNIASIYLHLKKYESAHKYLELALRFKRESWKIWDNFLSVSLQLGKVADAIKAYNSILDLNPKFVDINVIFGNSNLTAFVIS